MFCQNCGTNNVLIAVFCKSCGKKLVDANVNPPLNSNPHVESTFALFLLGIFKRIFDYIFEILLSIVVTLFVFFLIGWAWVYPLRQNSCRLKF